MANVSFLRIFVSSCRPQPQNQANLEKPPKTNKQTFRPYVSMLAELGSAIFFFVFSSFFFCQKCKGHIRKNREIPVCPKTHPHEGPFCIFNPNTKKVARPNMKLFVVGVSLTSQGVQRPELRRPFGHVFFFLHIMFFFFFFFFF